MELIPTTPPSLLTKNYDYPIIPNAYLEWIAKAHTQVTQQCYAYALLHWLEWCESHRIAWETVTRDQIFDYRNSLVTTKCGTRKSNRSINYALNRIIQFYDYAATQGLPSPIANLVRPKNTLRLRRGGPVRPIRLVSFEDVGIFLRGFTHIRDALIARVMFLCGLRRGEVLNMTRGILTIPPVGNVVTFKVCGKGDIVRPVEISTTLIKELTEYAKTTRGAYIFSVDGSRIHPDTITKAFAANRLRTGIKIHCHLLRHLYATFRLRVLEEEFEGGSGFNSALKTLQTELGHGNIETTSMYLHLAESQEASASLGHWQDRAMEEIENGGGT